jgi:FtsH-binding integral membrane protein
MHLTNHYIAKTSKVLAWQFSATFGAVLLATLVPAVENYVLDSLDKMLLVGSCGSLVMVLYMACSSNKNTFHVAIFTIFETMAVTALTMFYSRDVVIIAALITGGITLGLWVYAFTTTTDHTGLRSGLFSILSVLVFMGLFNIFLASDLLYRIDLYLGTILFMVYLVVDVQYYISKRLKEETVPDDLHIDAAMNIYLDVINIFIRVLHIVAKLRGEGRNSGRVSKPSRNKKVK